MDILLDEHKDLLLLLSKAHVKFVLIGGYAVIYHGYQRTTSDMDIWLEPDNENKARFVSAMEDLGIDKKSLDHIKALDFSEIHAFHFGKEPRKIDFLTKISGLTFKEAHEKADYFPLKKIQIPILHLDHLILSKVATNRAQDKADIERLQQIAKARSKK